MNEKHDDDDDDDDKTVSRQFLDRQFLHWVKVTVRVRVAVQELTVQELSCSLTKHIGSVYAHGRLLVRIRLTRLSRTVNDGFVIDGWVYTVMQRPWKNQHRYTQAQVHCMCGCCLLAIGRVPMLSAYVQRCKRREQLVPLFF